MAALYEDATGNDWAFGRRVSGRAGVPGVVTYHQLLSNNVVSCLTAVYDCAAVGKVFAPLIGCEDLGLWLRVLCQVGQGHGINEILAQYRLRPGSYSARKRDMARRFWQLYRQEGFGVVRSLWYFGGYALTGTLKTYFPKTASKLGVLITPAFNAYDGLTVANTCAEGIIAPPVHLKNRDGFSRNTTWS
jgi:hypothetical protein